MLVTYIKLINADWITVRWWEKTKKEGLNIEFLIKNLFFFSYEVYDGGALRLEDGDAGKVAKN